MRAHEKFEIEPEAALREPVVRQDRHESAGLVLRIGEVELAVTNFSAFGIGAVAHSRAVIAAEVDGALYAGGMEIARLRLSRAHQQRRVPDGLVVGFAITGEALDLTRVRAILAARAIVTEVSANDEVVAALPTEFRRQILEIKDRLERIEARTNALASQQPFMGREESDVFERGVADAVAQDLKDLLDPAYSSLGTLLDGLDGAQLKAAFDYFRSKLAHLIYQSPLSERIYEKPLGYAGDFEMMNLIYRDENVGKTLFAKCVHRYFVTHPNARAVRNRATYLSGHIARAIADRAPGSPLRIASVACGPAREVQELVEGTLALDGVQFALLDQDVTALRHAQHGITAACRRTGRSLDVNYVHKAIRNVLKEGLPGTYDLIYSAGLFDYFSDPVARHVATKLVRSLRPGGRLIIGNFTSGARSRVLMELALDWNLIYRTDGDLRALYSGLDAKVTIEAEPERINLFAVLEK
jgi:SAM-dependent methyltransferase